MVCGAAHSITFTKETHLSQENPGECGRGRWGSGFTQGAPGEVPISQGLASPRATVTSGLRLGVPGPRADLGPWPTCCRMGSSRDPQCLPQPRFPQRLRCVLASGTAGHMRAAVLSGRCCEPPAAPGANTHPPSTAALKSSPSKKGRSGALLAVKPLGPTAAFSASQIPSEREEAQYDLRGARSYPTLEDEGEGQRAGVCLWGPRYQQQPSGQGAGLILSANHSVATSGICRAGPAPGKSLRES
ncbi:hypothetical protein P7K49_032944 [Saguinus oedipus]|uniref:Uncharacterized protein n=1 Tax=Saguinus oedipus TaxID=9490 RepID=A0ABQ9TS78_SAGOE|nr:hypothetical protein P7K49_032944 [Saguinus oedipus]